MSASRQPSSCPIRSTGVLAYLRMLADANVDDVECGDDEGGGRSSTDRFDCGVLEALLTARCASPGTSLEGEQDLVCFSCGDVSMGRTKPLRRTYSCHLGSLRSGGQARDSRRGEFGSSFPFGSLDSLLESVEPLGETLVETIEPGRRLDSFLSLFLGLGAGLPSAGVMTEEVVP